MWLTPANFDAHAKSDPTSRLVSPSDHNTSTTNTTVACRAHEDSRYSIERRRCPKHFSTLQIATHELHRQREEGAHHTDDRYAELERTHRCQNEYGNRQQYGSEKAAEGIHDTHQTVMSEFHLRVCIRIIGAVSSAGENAGTDPATGIHETHCEKIALRHPTPGTGVISLWALLVRVGILSGWYEDAVFEDVHHGRRLASTKKLEGLA